MIVKTDANHLEHEGHGSEDMLKVKAATNTSLNRILKYREGINR